MERDDETGDRMKNLSLLELPADLQIEICGMIRGSPHLCQKSDCLPWTHDESTDDEPGTERPESKSTEEGCQPHPWLAIDERSTGIVDEWYSRQKLRILMDSWLSGERAEGIHTDLLQNDNNRRWLANVRHVEFGLVPLGPLNRKNVQLFCEMLTGVASVPCVDFTWLQASDEREDCVDDESDDNMDDDDSDDDTDDHGSSVYLYLDRALDDIGEKLPMLLKKVYFNEYFRPLLNLGAKHECPKRVKCNITHALEVTEAEITNPIWPNDAVVLPGDALVWACAVGSMAVVTLLLDGFKIPVNSERREGNPSPLWHAAHEGHQSIVELLLQYEKIDLNSVGEYHQTPLASACWKNHIGIVQLLANKPDVMLNTRDRQGLSALQYAINFNDDEMFDILVATHRIQRHDALCLASSKGRLRMVRTLLDGHPELCTQEDQHGKTPLWYASYWNKCEVLDILLPHSMSVLNKTCTNGWSPLFAACWLRSSDAVRRLASLTEIDPNTLGRVADWKTTALGIAMYNRDFRTIETLLQMKNIDVEKGDTTRTPCAMAESMYKLYGEKKGLDILEEYTRGKYDNLAGKPCA